MLNRRSFLRRSVTTLAAAAVAVVAAPAVTQAQSPAPAPAPVPLPPPDLPVLTPPKAPPVVHQMEYGAAHWTFNDLAPVVDSGYRLTVRNTNKAEGNLLQAWNADGSVLYSATGHSHHIGTFGVSPGVNHTHEGVVGGTVETYYRDASYPIIPRLSYMLDRVRLDGHEPVSIMLGAVSRVLLWDEVSWLSARSPSDPLSGKVAAFDGVPIRHLWDQPSVSAYCVAVEVDVKARVGKWPAGRIVALEGREGRVSYHPMLPEYEYPTTKGLG